MKKPLNKVALAIWVLAVAQLATQGWFFVGSYFLNDPALPGSMFRFLAVTWTFVHSGFVAAGELVALGAIIELVDQIRWNALSPEKRNRR